MKAVEMLQKPEVFTTVAVIIMYDRFGSEFIQWDPLTVNLVIKRDLEFTPTQNLKDKIMAGSTIIGTDMFYRSFGTFSTVCGVVGMSGYSTDVLIPPDADDVAWTCTEARLIDGDFDPSNFNPDIKKYAGFLLDREGIRTPPEVLSFADYPSTSSGGGLGDLEDDAGWMDIYMKGQDEKRTEFSKSLRNRTMDLFKQLEQLEDTDIDQKVVEDTMDRLL